MEAILFTVYLMALGAGLAMAGFGATLFARLFKRNKNGFNAFLATFMAGSLVQSAILLFVVVRAGQVRPTFEALLFLTGLSIKLVGMLGLTHYAIKEVARQEVIEKTIDRLSEAREGEEEK